MRDAIRPGQERGAEFRGHEPGRAHVSADVGVDDAADGHDAPVAIEADLDGVG